MKLETEEGESLFEVKVTLKWKYMYFVDIAALSACIDLKNHSDIVQAI